MTNLEKTEEDKFVKLILELPFPSIALKLFLAGARGWPDRTVFYRGELIFFEFKREDNKQSPQQRTWQKHLERLGFKYFVVHTANEAMELIYTVFLDKGSRGDRGRKS